MATQTVSAVFEGIEAAVLTNVRRPAPTRSSNLSRFDDSAHQPSSQADKRLRMQRAEVPVHNYEGAPVLTYKTLATLFPLRRGFVPSTAISAQRLRQLFLHHDNRFAHDATSLLPRCQHYHAPLG